MYQESEQLTANGMELVPFGSDSSIHRETVFKFSEKNGDPMGHEQLQEDGHVLVSFAKRASNRLSQEDLECLKAYYERKYETPLEVPNEVQKIKKIKVLGYVYGSRLTGRNNAAQIYAFRPDDYENDDLERVLDTRGEEHLRAGTVEYFFFHETVYHENDERFLTKHCFAFVSWYKNPRVGVEDFATGTSDTNRPFRKDYEQKSSYSILPVHKLYVPISICATEIDGVFIALPLTRMFF